MKNPFLWLLLLFCIAVGESLGSAYLIRDGRLQSWWWQIVSSHVALSSVAGWSGMMVLGANYFAQRRFVFFFLFLFAGCIPLLGSWGVLSLAVCFRYLGAPKPSVAIGSVIDPGFRRGGRVHDLQFYGQDVHSILSAGSISDIERIQALFKLQSLHSRQTAETFRSLLTDRSEDLRLVAFGLLDKTEKKIFSGIHQELTLLNQAVDDQHKLEHWRQLAYSYWELVYQKAAVGDVLNFAMSQIRVFATEVLFEEERDGGMWSLLGHVNFSAKDYEVARYCYSRALTCGLPESRIIPYMAEVLFAQCDYSNLKILLSIQTSLGDLATLKPVLDYWNFSEIQTERDGVLV